jgi:ubiquinone/menaquinone biosynthesis C-methylase UbiE
VELVRGDILSLPFPDHSFNAAFCRSCLHHLSDLGQGLRDICRVLKPGGLFLACNEHIVSLFSSGDRFRDAHPAVRCGVEERAYSTFHYRHALSKAGFGRIRVFGFPPSYEEFLELTRQNPMRARLVSLPIAGGALSRLLYAVHVVVRRHLRVPEEFLPAITLLARKAV